MFVSVLVHMFACFVLPGAIIDKTGDIGLAFYVGGGMIALGGLFHCMLHTPCVRQKKPYITTTIEMEDITP